VRLRDVEQLEAECLACACEVPDDAPTAPPPAGDELRLLRERVDIHGTLST
jgi:ferredoxin